MTDRAGPARALVSVYVLFALAAGARSVVQIGTRFDAAPLPYALSAVAAVVYMIAAVTIGAPSRRGWALAACGFELAGVLIVGTLSVLEPGPFPDETVWSGYGRGYGYVPLLLPVLGLVWLRIYPRMRAFSSASSSSVSTPDSRSFASRSS